MLAATQVIAGPAWRWVDANGTVHYSDRPVPGAEQVNLPESSPRAPQTPGTPAAPPASAPATAAEAEAAAVSEAPAAYTRLAIVSPSADETLWNLGGELTVTIDVAPALQNGHVLRLYYDGEPVVTGASSGTRLTVTDVYRGSHTVQAEIVDSRDMPVMRSLQVQFFVQQTSTQNPNLANPNRANPNRANPG